MSGIRVARARAAADIAVQVFGRALNLLPGLVVAVILTRSLGDDGFGSWSTALAIVQIAAPFGDFGLEQVAVRKAAAARHEERHWIGALISLRFALALPVAMVTAIVSVMTGIPARRDVAMTGEITLRGRVLPIAGLKEKLLAALRGGIKTVLIPEENAKDLVEISESIKKGLDIVPVSRMDAVLARAMTREPERIEWDETTTTAAAVPEEAPVEEEVATLTAH